MLPPLPGLFHGVGIETFSHAKWNSSRVYVMAIFCGTRDCENGVTQAAVAVDRVRLRSIR